MTGLEAARWADALSPNAYAAEIKLSWLSDLDGKFYLEFLSRYNGCADEPPEPYTDGGETLLIPEPYARGVYGNYLLAKIAEANQEITLYNQYSTMFNTEFGAYCESFNRDNALKPGRSWVY